MYWWQVVRTSLSTSLLVMGLIVHVVTPSRLKSCLHTFPKHPFSLSSLHGNDQWFEGNQLVIWLGGMSSSRLRTCQWSKRMPLNLNLHPHPRFYFQSSLSLFQLGPANLKWSISSEYSPAVWKERGPVFLQVPSSAYFLTFILPLFLSYAVW